MSIAEADIQPLALDGSFTLRPPSAVERNQTFEYAISVTNTGTSSETFDIVTVLSGGGLPSRVQIDRVSSLTLAAGETQTFNVTVVGAETDEFEPNDYILESLSSIGGLLDVIDQVAISIEEGIGLAGSYTTLPPRNTAPGVSFGYEIALENLSSSSLAFDIVTVISGGDLPSRTQVDRIAGLSIGANESPTVAVTVDGAETQDIAAGTYLLETLGANAAGRLDQVDTHIISLGTPTEPNPTLVALGALAGGVAGLGLGTTGLGAGAGRIPNIYGTRG